MDNIEQESAHVILETLMKKLRRPVLMIGLSLFLALFSAAISYSALASPLPNLSGATVTFQTTPTPQIQDHSEAGSTDQIVIMGGIIALIIFAPILIGRRTWRP
jgi:hypothetical protein